MCPPPGLKQADVFVRDFMYLKPTFWDHLNRRDKVAFWDGLQLLMSAKPTEDESKKRKVRIEQVYDYEKAILKFDKAIFLAKERPEVKDDDAKFLIEQARELRRKAYLGLSMALREMGPKAREGYLADLSGWGMREKVYGDISVRPSAPMNPSEQYGMYSGLNAGEPAVGVHVPSESEMRGYREALKKYEVERDAFFVSLAKICGNRSRPEPELR